MILIVDDSTRMRGTIRTMLQNTKHEFLECTDGLQALELYARHRPAWVLMDVRMQTMDGISATKELKAAFPSARVVIVTNYNDPQLRADANEAGAEAFVSKDDLSQLLDIIATEES